MNGNFMPEITETFTALKLATVETITERCPYMSAGLKKNAFGISGKRISFERPESSCKAERN